MMMTTNRNRETLSIKKSSKREGVGEDRKNGKSRSINLLASCALSCILLYSYFCSSHLCCSAISNLDPSELKETVGEKEKVLLRLRRAATARLDRLWDDAVIPYEIDPAFSEERAALFRSAMQHWENYTCIKFVERSPDEHRNYIVFTERSCGCCSFVGKRGNGAQAISIGKHCDKFGIVVHELGHVVGFWHEHTRPDRDQHVQIISKNIMSGQEYNFNKLTKDEVNSLGLAYDYDSILHYATNTFAKDTYLDTILPLHGHLNTEDASPTQAPPATSSGPQTTQQSIIDTSTGSQVAGASSKGQMVKLLSSSEQQSTITGRPLTVNSSTPTTMINDSPARKHFQQLQDDFQSMLHYVPTHKSTGQSPRVMLLDGDVVIALNQPETPTETESEETETETETGQKRNRSSRRKSRRARRRRSNSMMDDSSKRLDVDDSLHMLAMDNMLAKTRPEIGQRVRLSVGDIAQTNLLYKCPKCGRTILQTNGLFHSPNYYAIPANINTDNQFDRPASDMGQQQPSPHHSTSNSTGSNSDKQDVSKSYWCEWRLTVGQGERILINITDLDLASPTTTTTTTSKSITSVANHKLSMPKAAFNDRELKDTLDYSEQNSYTNHRYAHSHDQVMIMRGCLLDYIEIRDGYTSRAPLIAKLCGHISSLKDIIRPIVSTGNRMLVTYKTSDSSASMNKRGFLAQHEAICGGYVILGNTLPRELLHFSYDSQTSSSSSTSMPTPSQINVNKNPKTSTVSTESSLSSVTTNSRSASINGSSPTINEILLSSQANHVRHSNLQSQHATQIPINEESSLISSSSSSSGANSSSIGALSDITNEALRSNLNANGAIRTYGWSEWPPVNTSIIQTPNWPEHYRASKECIWQIRADENYQISLRFESFDLESHDSCAYDYVEIRDGDNLNSELIGRFCGNKMPDQILSSSSTLMMKFVSDSDVNRAGFFATLQPELDECKLGTHGCSYKCSNSDIPYKCECPNGQELASDGRSCVPTCGGIRNESTGRISSPSFPDLYPINTKCIWEIIAPAYYRITLNFTHFNLEGNKAQECEYDYVDIRSKLTDGKQVKNGIFCGLHQNLVVTSDSNVMRIEFNSDNSIQKSGFMSLYFIDKDECAVNNGGCQHVCTNTNGSYQCLCNNGFVLHENRHECLEGHCTHTILTPDGSFHTPGFPNSYQPNKECAWLLQTKPGHRIKLNFDQFDLESHQECAYDHVAVFDGESIDDPALGRFCGSRRPLTLVSSFNTLYLLFQSDATNERRGFNASHTTVCGGRMQANLNQNDLIYSHASFNGTSLYNRNEDCEWLIEANYNQKVRIEFTFFSLEADNNCNYDQTIIYDGVDDTATQLARLCGSDIPKDLSRITSSGESMVIVFKSDDSINNRGFSLTYSAIETSEDETIVITSPTGKKFTPESS